MTQRGTRLLAVGDGELCWQSFGDAGDPTVLLVAGAAASMDWWEVDLCLALAAGGRHVVRYDHRDTGRSSGDPPGHPRYSALHLQQDCVGLLEELGPDRVHVVGISMGGGIAQAVAITHPDRVATLTAMSTTAVSHVGDLPGPVPQVAASFAEPASDPDWTDRDAVVDWYLRAERVFSGALGVDEPSLRRVAGLVFDRSRDLASAANHWLAVTADGEQQNLDVHDITVPTLVVHGSDDPLLPLEHGRALAGAIRGARLLVLDGVGHQVPPRSTWDVVVAAILEHTTVRP